MRLAFLYFLVSMVVFAILLTLMATLGMPAEDLFRMGKVALYISLFSAFINFLVFLVSKPKKGGGEK